MNSVVSERFDDCVLIRLSNGVTNVLTTEVVRALSAALADAELNARGVLLCGGDKFFSNGVDLQWALAQSTAGMRAMLLELGNCVLRIMESPLPIVGVIRGHAVGAAMALLLACDYRYAAEGRVLIGKPEILLGVPNPYFADQLVRFVAGDFVGSDLLYTGKLISGEQALAQRLIHGVGVTADIESIAWQQLKFLCQLAPEAFAETKNMRSGRFCADIRQQMSARVARQVEIWNSEDAQSRLREAAKRLAR